jgi:hypothetical protein
MVATITAWGEASPEPDHTERVEDRLVGSQGQALRLGLGDQQAVERALTGVSPTTGSEPRAITTSSPASAEAMSLESWVLAWWTV